VHLVDKSDHGNRRKVTRAALGFVAVRARVPASSANLGPGFDALALALALYVEVEIEPADALTITAEGEGSDLPTTSEHLAAQVVRSIHGHDRFAITVRSDIPVGRGLGSSASNPGPRLADDAGTRARTTTKPSVTFCSGRWSHLSTERHPRPHRQEATPCTTSPSSS
jgi:homoserine kinase